MITLLVLLAVADPLPLPAPASTPWRVVRRVDPMTDKTSIGIRAVGGAGAINIGCDAPGPHSVRVSFATTVFLGQGDRDGLYRFDDNKATRLYLNEVDDLARTFDDKQATALINGIASASRLRVRLSTYKGEFVDLDFDLVGAAKLIADELPNCLDQRFSALPAR